MTTFRQNNIQQLFLGSAATKTTSGINDMNTGEIAIFTPGGTMYTESTADANDEFKIVLNRGTTYAPLVSEVIRKDLVDRVSLRTAVAAAEQLDYVGYNGTTGSIEAIDDNFYRLRVNIKEGIVSNHGGIYVKDLIYKSDATANQAEIAIGLAGSGIDNFSREADSNTAGTKPITFKALCNTAASATNDLTNDVTITKGSKVFSVLTALTYNGTASTLVAGDYIRFAATLNGTLALTDDVYKVVSISGLNVTVDRPIQVPSGTWTDAGDGSQVIPAATAIAADWGVALTGQAVKFQVGKNHYRKMKWNTTLENFGTTNTDLENTSASVGTGTNEQIAELEWGLNGNFGEIHRMGEPNIFALQSQLTASATYDLIEILYRTQEKDGLISMDTRKQIIIAVPNTTPNWAVTGTSDDTTDVLEDLLDGVPFYSAGAFSGGLTGADLDL
jgi:hypothetical protein